MPQDISNLYLIRLVESRILLFVQNDQSNENYRKRALPLAVLRSQTAYFFVGSLFLLIQLISVKGKKSLFDLRIT